VNLWRNIEGHEAAKIKLAGRLIYVVSVGQRRIVCTELEPGHSP